MRKSLASNPIIRLYQVSLLLLLSLALSLLSGCETKYAEAGNELKSSTLNFTAIDSDVVLAFNIGGGEYQGVDGVKYQADKLPLNASVGVVT
ncbi:hypothetical protein AADZ86_12400 [Colwelliaceae bacterium BS250]